jgi:enamine deaminase RidA (YjgF/YER057c/UK114 family)
MTQTPSDRMATLGIDLPPVPEPVAAYVPAVAYADLIQTAGQIPVRDARPIATGSVPEQVSTEEARACARQCALNAIAAAAHAAGGVDNLERPLKVTCFVACSPGFTGHPTVADGASTLLAEVFGDHADHARAAVGAPSLPLGVPVEVEILFRRRTN